MVEQRRTASESKLKIIDPHVMGAPDQPQSQRQDDIFPESYPLESLQMEMR
jgi:hypothetical protein